MSSNRSLDILFDQFVMRVDHLAPNTYVVPWNS
jgi:hypothetical protein